MENALLYVWSISQKVRVFLNYHG